MRLDTSRQFVDSAFGKPLVVRMHGAWIFLHPIGAVHLEMSCQFVSSVFGTPLVVRIHGDLYLFLGIYGSSSVACSNLAHHEQYFFLT